MIKRFLSSHAYWNDCPNNFFQSQKKILALFWAVVFFNQLTFYYTTYYGKLKLRYQNKMYYSFSLNIGIGSPGIKNLCDEIKY